MIALVKKGLTNSQPRDIINIENDKAKSLKLGVDGIPL